MVWATDYFTDSAVRIDPLSNRVVARLSDLPHGPTGVAIGEGAVWIVTSSGCGRLVRVAAVVEVGNDPMGVVAAFGSIWVQNEFGGTVTRVDAATNRVVATIKVNPREGREGLDTLVSFRGGIWLGGYAIQMIDPATNAVTRQLRADAIGIAAGSGAIWPRQSSGHWRRSIRRGPGRGGGASAERAGELPESLIQLLWSRAAGGMEYAEEGQDLNRALDVDAVAVDQGFDRPNAPHYSF